MSAPSSKRFSLEDRIQQLIAFEADHGHTMVPKDFKMGLGIWVKNMRFQRSKSKIKPDVVAQLDSINFLWSVPKGRDKEKVVEWGKHFKWVADFSKAKGHCRVPAIIGGKAVPAADWCDEQRRLYMENKLGSDKFEKLQKIGFDFYGSEEETPIEDPVSASVETACCFCHSPWSSHQISNYHPYRPSVLIATPQSPKRQRTDNDSGNGKLWAKIQYLEQAVYALQEKVKSLDARK